VKALVKNVGFQRIQLAVSGYCRESSTDISTTIN